MKRNLNKQERRSMNQLNINKKLNNITYNNNNCSQLL